MRHLADTYEFEDGRKLRLLNDSILVRMDPESEMLPSGIIKPDGVVAQIHMTGTVLAFGWRKSVPLADTTKVRQLPKPIPIPDLKVGDKCVFIRYRRWQDTNKQLRTMFEDDIIALKPEDLFFVFTGDIELD